MTKNELFAGYIPVIHDGYIRAFDRHPKAAVGIFDDEVLKDFDYLRKDIRALCPEDAQHLIEGLGRNAIILGRNALTNALKSPITMPDDDITREIIRANPSADITTEPVFLRWDRDNSTEKSLIIPDRTIKVSKDNDVIRALNYELSKSPNWFRHVGAIIHDKQDNVWFTGHNSSLPTEYTSAIECDPRITARKGEDIDRSIDTHAEWNIIAEAAKTGIALDGLSITVSTFPCPTCAKLIALSGIKTCNYVEGYSVLDGYNVLKSFGVEIVKLDVELDDEDPRILKPYPTSQS